MGNNVSFKQKFQAWIKGPDFQTSPIQPWQKRGLLCCLILIFALVVSSHPLTPFFVLLSVYSLVIFRRCSPFWLPILMTVMTVGWLLTVAQPYVSQHLNMIAGNLGDVSGNVPTSITRGKMVSDPVYQIIAKTRLFMTILLWFLALLGSIKRLRQGNRDITYMLLALAGSSLIVAQSYGGEMLMRIYLFTEPFMAFFAAALFCESPTLMARTRTISSARTAAIIAANLILLGGFFFTRYGDERVDYVTFAEWDGVQYLYQIAPAKAFILEAWDDVPLHFENYEKYDIETLSVDYPNVVIQANANKLIQFLVKKNNPKTYIIISREEQIHATAWDGLPSNTLQRLETAMLQSGKFTIIYHNFDTQILQFSGMGRGAS